MRCRVAPIKSVIFILMLLPCTGFGEKDTTASASVGAQLRHDGLTVLNGAAFVITSPTRWEGGDWLKAGGTLGLTGGASFLDNDVQRLMDRNRTTGTDRLEKVTVIYAEGATVIGISVGLYVAGLISSDRWVRETGLLAGTAVALCGAVSEVSKILVGRGRPYAGFGNHEFSPFTLKDEFHSFPSGHTVAGFALSTVLASRIDNPWASIGLYALATGSALSRIYSSNHWFSDVLFSAILSVSTSRSLLRWYDGEDEHSSSNKLEVRPSAGGIAIIWKLQ